MKAVTAAVSQQKMSTLSIYVSTCLVPYTRAQLQADARAELGGRHRAAERRLVRRQQEGDDSRQCGRVRQFKTNARVQL